MSQDSNPHEVVKLRDLADWRASARERPELIITADTTDREDVGIRRQQWGLYRPLRYYLRSAKMTNPESLVPYCPECEGKPERCPMLTGDSGPPDYFGDNWRRCPAAI